MFGFIGFPALGGGAGLATSIARILCINLAALLVSKAFELNLSGIGYFLSIRLMEKLQFSGILLFRHSLGTGYLGLQQAFSEMGTDVLAVYVMYLMDCMADAFVWVLLGLRNYHCRDLGKAKI